MPASPRWSTGILLTLCGALATVVALELDGELALAPGVTAASREAVEVAVAEPARYEPPAPEAFAVIAERPLFSESRRPRVAEQAPEAPPEPAPEPETSPLAVQLIGVLLTDHRRAALVLPEGAAGATWLREGESIDGWRIETVEHDRATLTRDGRSEVVELRAD